MAAVLATAAAAALAVPGSALAATSANVTANGNVSGSGFSLSAAPLGTPTFSANVDNGDSTPTFSIPIVNQDTRGSGAGWQDQITSTQYTTGGATPQTLDVAASTITGVTSACNRGRCTAPTNSVSYPVGVPAAATAPAAVKFFNAAANTGLGKFTITPTVAVSVPQDTYAGSYNSTVTLSVVTGP